MTPNDIPAYMAHVGAAARAAATVMAAAPAAAKDQALRALATRLRAGVDALQAANTQDLQAAQAMHHGKGLAAPLEFMQRLAALVPRPRLHGVLAPSSSTSAKLRAMLLPQGPDESTERV